MGASLCVVPDTFQLHNMNMFHDCCCHPGLLLGFSPNGKGIRLHFGRFKCSFGSDVGWRFGRCLPGKLVPKWNPHSSSRSSDCSTYQVVSWRRALADPEMNLLSNTTRQLDHSLILVIPLPGAFLRPVFEKLLYIEYNVEQVMMLNRSLRQKWWQEKWL